MHPCTSSRRTTLRDCDRQARRGSAIFAETSRWLEHGKSTPRRIAREAEAARVPSRGFSDATQLAIIDRPIHPGRWPLRVFPLAESFPIFVHFLPNLSSDSALSGGSAVVIDVLRATTAMVQALAAGCRRVLPCLEIDEARSLAASLPEGSALLAGERQGLPIEGFQFGNSPSGFTPESCGGRDVVMTTTNGTKALLASLAAERVYVAAFVNRTAMEQELADGTRPVHLICAGTDGLVSLEDSLFAGALAAGLTRSGQAGELANDEARMLVRLWNSLGVDEAIGHDTALLLLAEVLREGRGGRRVHAIGLELDLLDSCRIDRFDLVAEVERDPTRVVRKH